MVSTDPKFHSGHRERLRQKFLDNKLAEYEKLEMLLGYVVPRRDVRPLAHALLKKFGSLGQVLTAPYETLIAFPGVGQGIAIFLKLINEIILDGYRNTLVSCPIFHNHDVLQNYCKWELANKPVEEFHVLYLDAEHRLIKDEAHSVGTFNSSSVYVREIIKHALDLNALNIVLVHNHPTTDKGFSSEDIETTEILQKLLRDLDITLIDHILVSPFSLSSAKSQGLMHD